MGNYIADDCMGQLAPIFFCVRAGDACDTQ